MSEIKDIPKGWRLKKLGEVCKLKNGYAFKSDSYENSGVPVIRISDINGGIVSSHKAVRVQSDEEYENYLVENNDILVAMSGATTGKFGIYKSTEKAYQNQRVGKFKILDENILNNEFLYHQINSLKRQIEKDAYGGAQPNISSTKIEQMQIVVPPIPEQQAIVSKIEELLSELENGKEQLKTAQQQLKVYRQSLLKWAFEGKLTNKNVKEGELPKGWKKVQIKDVAETFGGYAFKSGEFLPQGKYQVLRMGNVRPGVIRYSESPVYLDKVDGNVLNRALLQTNDVIITQTGTRKKRDYGFTVLITKPNLLLNQRIASFRFNESYLPKFFLYFSWTDLFKDQFFANETGNVGQGNVGMKAVTETLIPFLSYNEQLLIVEELESKLTVCDKIEETINQSLQQAETLRQSILKKAFEGKLV
jgi:type I restriction enzyme S subunit